MELRHNKNTINMLPDLSELTELTELDPAIQNGWHSLPKYKPFY